MALIAAWSRGRCSALGGSYMSLCDGLVDALEEHIGYVPLEKYTLEISIPSKYMASILWKEMKAVIAPVL